MKPLTITALVLLCLGARPAAADGLADNPAFCYGLVSAQSPADGAFLAHREARVRALFARRGPKDCNEERGFDDFAAIGRATAGDTGARADAARLAACRRLLGPVGR